MGAPENLDVQSRESIQHVNGCLHVLFSIVLNQSLFLNHLKTTLGRTCTRRTTRAGSGKSPGMEKTGAEARRFTASKHFS